AGPCAGTSTFGCAWGRAGAPLPGPPAAGPGAAPPGPGRGPDGARIRAHTVRPAERKRTSTADPASVSCQPPDVPPPVAEPSWVPHCMQYLAPATPFAPQCAQNLTGIGGARALTEAARRPRARTRI